MGCCIALALIIGMVRLAWFRLVKGETPQRTGFAPPARRAGPGASPAVVATRVSPPVTGRSDHPRTERPRTERPRTEPRRAATGPVLALAALVGFGVYSALLTLSARTGVVQAMDHGMSEHRRDLILIAGGVAAAVVARILRVHRAAPAERTRHRGLALVGAGSAWSLLSVLDMHVTGMVAAHHTDVLADVLLHGPGILALVLGTSLLLTGDRRPNSLSLTTTRGTS